MVILLGKYQNGLGELIDLDFKTEFEVISSDPDTTAPELKKLELSKDKFDVSQGDATFDLSTKFTDDLSGLLNQYVQISWRSPSGEQIYIVVPMQIMMRQYYQNLKQYFRK